MGNCNFFLLLLEQNGFCVFDYPGLGCFIFLVDDIRVDSIWMERYCSLSHRHLQRLFRRLPFQGLERQGLVWRWGKTFKVTQKPSSHPPFERQSSKAGLWLDGLAIWSGFERNWPRKGQPSQRQAPFMHPDQATTTQAQDHGQNGRRQGRLPTHWPRASPD